MKVTIHPVFPAANKKQNIHACVRVYTHAHTYICTNTCKIR